MIIAGIILILFGLGLFIGTGMKLDDSPGLEKSHLYTMLAGLAAIIIGGIMLYTKVFGG